MEEGLLSRCWLFGPDPRMKRMRDRHRFACITFLWRMDIRRQNAMQPNQYLSHIHSMRGSTHSGTQLVKKKECRI